MPDLEYWLIGLLAGGLVLGTWSILWARVARCRQRASWGRRLFVFTLLITAASTLVAAVSCPQWLAPLGLSVGWMVVVMLWERPHPA